MYLHSFWFVFVKNTLYISVKNKMCFFFLLFPWTAPFSHSDRSRMREPPRSWSRRRWRTASCSRSVSSSPHLKSISAWRISREQMNSRYIPSTPASSRNETTWRKITPKRKNTCGESWQTIFVRHGSLHCSLSLGLKQCTVIFFVILLLLDEGRGSDTNAPGDRQTNEDERNHPEEVQSNGGPEIWGGRTEGDTEGPDSWSGERSGSTVSDLQYNDRAEHNDEQYSNS